MRKFTAALAALAVTGIAVAGGVATSASTVSARKCAPPAVASANGPQSVILPAC